MSKWFSHIDQHWNRTGDWLLSGRGQAISVLALLMTHAGLLAYSATCHSPTLNEPGLLAAGVSHWQLGRFEMYRVNPPLVRMIAAIPVLAVGVKTDWHQFYEGPGARPEFAVGSDFIAANGPRSIWLTTLARWACLPFSLLGALICFLWARELYGTRAGLLAMSLWCFCPNILGHGSLITADVPAAALALAASYSFWRWQQRPAWGRALTTGALLGLAELTKTTLIVFYLLWPCLWIVGRLSERSQPDRRGTLREAAMLIAILLVSVYAINVGYGFEGSCTRLGSYRFVSKLLTAAGPDRVNNRFVETPLAVLPVPLPTNYVRGLDAQRHDFEHYGKASYLRGTFQKTGWWYYYLYGFAVKISLCTWGLLFLVVTLHTTRRLAARSHLAEFMLLAPALLLIVVVSSQTGFNEHLRYALPILPFVFIWIGQIAETSCRRWRLVTVAALVGSIASCLATYPHNLSYFNELAGGPLNGHAHLLGSNVEWGQDFLSMRRWSEAHPQAKPLFVGGDRFFNPVDIGIDAIDLNNPKPAGRDAEGTLTPGWYALGVNELVRRGVLESHHENWESTDTLALHLRDRRPIARAGYSIYIYHVAPAAY